MHRKRTQLSARHHSAARGFVSGVGGGGMGERWVVEIADGLVFVIFFSAPKSSCPNMVHFARVAAHAASKHYARRMLLIRPPAAATPLHVPCSKTQHNNNHRHKCQHHRRCSASVRPAPRNGSDNYYCSERGPCAVAAAAAVSHSCRLSSVRH